MLTVSIFKISNLPVASAKSFLQGSDEPVNPSEEFRMRTENIMEEDILDLNDLINSPSLTKSIIHLITLINFSYLKEVNV